MGLLSPPTPSTGGVGAKPCVPRRPMCTKICPPPPTRFVPNLEGLMSRYLQMMPKPVIMLIFCLFNPPNCAMLLPLCARRTPKYDVPAMLYSVPAAREFALEWCTPTVVVGVAAAVVVDVLSSPRAVSGSCTGRLNLLLPGGVGCGRSLS